MALAVSAAGTRLEGNDQTLPKGIEPLPHEERPSRVSTRIFTVKTVACVLGTPPNLSGVRYATRSIEGSTSATRTSVERAMGGDCTKWRRSHLLFGRRVAMSSENSSDTKGRTMALVAAFLGWMFDGLEMGLCPLAGRTALKDMMRHLGADEDKYSGPWFGGIIAA